MSDEIPIGSPPAPAGRHAAPPGWYSDPLDRANERYWDGWQWSRSTRVASSPQPQLPAGTGRPVGRPVAEPPRWTPRSAAGQGQPYAGRGLPGGYGSSTAVLSTADGVPLSSWGARVLAAVVDVIGIGLVGLVAALPFYLDLIRFVWSFWLRSLQTAQQGGAPPSSPGAEEIALHYPLSDQIWAGLITSIIAVAYYALLWRFRSATLGQLIFGLRVVPVDQGRDRLGWNTVIVRALIWVLPLKLGYLIFFWVLDCLSPLWNAKRQALHDLAAKTQVVKIR